MLGRLLALAAPLPLAAAAALDDGAAALAAMKAAAAKLKTLHAIVRCEEYRDGEIASTRFVECWIDVRRGRVRTELRDFGKASPRLVFVADPEGVRIEQLEFEEMADQRRKLDLASALPATLAGELLSTAFRGDLVTFKLAAYGRPAVASMPELVGATSCARLDFAGNGAASLCIAESDHLPRRIRGPLPGGATLEETIVRLDLDAGVEHVEFEMPVAEGHHLPDPAEVRARWSSPPPEPQRWLAPGEDAPDFAALDLDATMHQFSETAEEEVVLAFWTVEDERSVEQAALAEKEWRAAGAKGRFLHVAAGSEREPVVRAIAKHSIREHVWVAGSRPGDAFRSWRIWSCPVFARVSDLQVTAVTNELAALRGWLK